MENFEIEYAKENATTKISYCKTVTYKTLMESLRGILAIKDTQKRSVVLDFGEVDVFLTSYRQIVNFRNAFQIFLPKEQTAKFTIITPKKAFWSHRGETSMQATGNDMINFIFRESLFEK
jgi:hypothetical protein